MQWIDNQESQHHAVYGKTLKLFNIIGGDECEGNAGERVHSTNPADHSDVVASMPTSSPQDVQRAIDVAYEAWHSWRQTPAPIRANIIGRFGELLQENLSELAFLVTREMGKVRKEAIGSIQEAIDTAQFFQSEGRRLYGQTVPSEMRNKELSTYRRAKGVVGVITPANFPIAVPAWKLIPALLCGNTAVWKPAPDAPACAYLFAKLFEAAGLPKGVLNVVFGFGTPTGQALVDAVADGKVRKISFTGSTAVGRQVGETCGRNLIIPSLELGGKNPLIVMDDADLDQAVEGAIFSTYGTGGQRCTSCGNIILHEKIYDAFKQRFLKRMQTLTIGNPILHPDVTYGPMISAAFSDNFLKHFEVGKTDGATLLTGSGRITKETPWQHFLGDPDAGHFCHPTLWEGVKPPMQLALEEVFGPMTSLIKVSSLEEALKVANAPNYGLSSAIYTQNRNNILTFKNNIEAGMSSINNSTTGAEAHLPFGGIKGSGNGTRESGIWVIEAYTYWHSVNDDMSGGLQLAQMDTEQVEGKEVPPMQELLPTGMCAAWKGTTKDAN